MAIEKLALADAMDGSTYFAVSIDGQDYRIAPSAIVEFLNGELTFPGALVSQYASPSATGFSVTIASADTHLILSPLAGYAAGTIVLPSATDGQELLVNCTQSVAALTITGAAIGAPSSLAANGFFRLKYDGIASTWYRVG
jgi:hypothetical protein